MPVPKGTKFRVKRTKTGKTVRLAIRGGRVIEATPLSGRTRT